MYAPLSPYRESVFHLCAVDEQWELVGVRITPLLADDMWGKVAICLKYKLYMRFIRCAVQHGVQLLAKIGLNQTLASLFIVLKVGKVPFVALGSNTDEIIIV